MGMYGVGIYEEILFPAVSSSVNDSILSLYVCIIALLKCTWFVKCKFVSLIALGRQV